MTNARKKILYIVEADLMSGSGKCAIELIQLLKNKTEFEPVVVTQFLNNLNYACDKLQVENYNVHYARTCSLGWGVMGWLIAFFCRPFLNYLSYRKLKKTFDFKSVYLIHSNSSSIDFGAYLHRKLRIPHIWHIREFLIFNHSQKSIIQNLPKYISCNSSCIIAVSNQLKEFIQSKVECANIKTIYDGVHYSNSKANPEPNEKSDKLRIVCVGNLTPLKGQDCLLNAISLLPPDILNNISVDLYGSNTDGFEQALKTIAHEKAIEHVVSFKGFCNNVLSILSNYDIGIHPSYTEGFSRVTIEYMLAGLCVIGNGNTSIREQIEDEQSGLLYDGNSPQSLANKIEYCFNNRNKMIQLGQQAQKTAIDQYCIENNFQKIVDEYRQIERRI